VLKSINIFGDSNSVISNPFGLTITSGNDVAIVEYNGKYYLDITYTLNGANNIANINNPYLGDVLIKGESDTVGTATIVIHKINGNNISLTVNTVNFKWLAPKLGDFMYADGSYSKAYDSNKTLIGLVFAVNSESDTTGTAYILGKEYSSKEPLLLGYSSKCEGDANQ
jgi:hypothetical protein